MPMVEMRNFLDKGVTVNRLLQMVEAKRGQMKVEVESGLESREVERSLKRVEQERGLVMGRCSISNYGGSGYKSRYWGCGESFRES